MRALVFPVRTGGQCCRSAISPEPGCARKIRSKRTSRNMIVHCPHIGKNKVCNEVSSSSSSSSPIAVCRCFIIRIRTFWNLQRKNNIFWLYILHFHMFSLIVSSRIISLTSHWCPRLHINPLLRVSNISGRGQWQLDPRNAASSDGCFWWFLTEQLPFQMGMGMRVKFW